MLERKQKTQTTQTDCSAIVQRAKERLQKNETFRGRLQLIHIDEKNGRLVLHGQLPSYYLKQLLQTTLSELDGVEEIDNQVDVFWPEEE